MSAREDFAGLIRATERRRLTRALDDRALRILTDGRNHAPQSIHWAIKRVPEMAAFTASELALGRYEVHRT